MTSASNTPEHDKSSQRYRGPWTHRLLVGVFSLLFGLLLYWLLGFVLKDIATWPGPKYSEFEKQMIDASLTGEEASLKDQISDTRRSISENEQRQKVLRDSTSNSEKTMNQLLELQKLTLQKGMTPSETEQAALGESEQLFLTNQRRYQDINETIASRSETLRDLEARQRESQRRLADARQPIREAFDKLEARYRWKLAALQMVFLLPLLAVGAWLFLKKRGGVYSPLSYGFSIALLVQFTMVLHQHFPSRYFKYVLVGVAVVVVARVLIYLLRMVAFPKRDWLIKQHREAYEHFMCPVCAYPIRRGPLRFLYWTRRSLKKLKLPADGGVGPEASYTCPSCGTSLFEKCDSCSSIRHALLPNCSQCGAEKVIQSPVSETRTPKAP